MGPLTPDSPLAALPARLDRDQAMFLDGMRYSVEMTDLAYTRLRNCLYRVAVGQREGKSYTPALPTALLDAWSMVDNLHRFRELLQQMRGIKQRSADVQLFLRRSAKIEDLRNGVQHLPTEIRDLRAANLTVWGVLHWFVLWEVEGRGKANAYALIAGSVDTATLGPVATDDRAVQAPIDLITLDAHGSAVCLSDMWRALAEYVAGFEAILRPQFAGMPLAKRDLLATWTIDFPDGVTEVPDPNTGASHS